MASFLVGGGGINKLSLTKTADASCFYYPFFSKTLLATACSEVLGIKPAAKFQG